MDPCCCPNDLDDGAPASGGFELAFDLEVVTAGAAPATVRIGELPVDGAAIHANLEVVGTQITPGAQAGFRGAWALNNGQANRSSLGVGSLNTISLLNGYEDPAAPPWTTPGALPAGWAYVAPAMTGNVFELGFNSAAGQGVRWRIVGTVVYYNGAIP